jgi:AcrR family transcriptional regulator
MKVQKKGVMDGYQRRTETKKHKILSAAKDLFSRHGFRKVTVDEIAALAEVSKVSIYSYFQNKEGLIHALVADSFREQKASIEELIHSDIPFPDKLKGIILRKADTSNRYSKEYLEQLLAHPAWKLQPVGEIEALMFEFFNQGKTEGHIRKEIPNQVLQLYIEIFKAGSESSIQALSALEKDDIQLIISMFFRGLATSE